MLTLACVLRSGGEYEERHVERLMRQVEGRLSAPYRFVCLSDATVLCERIPLVMGWPGWWSKIEMFRPGLFDDRVLYLDLDVMVVGALDDLAFHPGPFVISHDFIPTRMKDGRPIGSKFNSSVMAWTPSPETERIYTEFTPAVMDRLRGDQDHVAEIMPKATTFGLGLVVSYKAHVRSLGRIPASARIVVYHGRPKPWDVKS